jgi:tRNA threonylcarbamoyladenosine biosynthesis protein TsaE
MTGPLVVTTTGAEETRDLAAALAELARPGDLVVLVGDLGAGKTVFTQGLGRGLGIDEQITSPTFALVQSYVGRLDLHHLDVYRLDQVNEALDLGLAEMLDDDAVMVIEWGDTIAPVLPHDYLEVRLSYGDDGDERRVELVPVGHRWSARGRALATVVDRVMVGGDDGPASDGPASEGPAGEGPASEGPAGEGLASEGSAGEGPADAGPAPDGSPVDGGGA